MDSVSCPGWRSWWYGGERLSVEPAINLECVSLFVSAGTEPSNQGTLVRREDDQGPPCPLRNGMQKEGGIRGGGCALSAGATIVPEIKADSAPSACPDSLEYIRLSDASSASCPRSQSPSQYGNSLYSWPRH